MNSVKSWFIAGGALILFLMSGYVFWQGMFGQSTVQVAVSVLLWLALTAVQFSFTEIVGDFYKADKLLYFGGVFSYAVGIGVGTMTWEKMLALPSGDFVEYSLRLLTAFGIAGTTEIIPEKLLRMWWNDYKTKLKSRPVHNTPVTTAPPKPQTTVQRPVINNPRPGFPSTQSHTVGKPLTKPNQFDRDH